MKDEKIIKPTNIYAFLEVAKFGFLSLVSLLIAIKFINLLVFVSIFLAGMALYRYLYIIFTEYRITEETIVVRTGIIARNYNSIELYRVKDYVMNQSVVMRIFGIMTIKLISNDLTHPVFEMSGIPFSNLTDEIRELVQKARINNRIYEIN